jgi:hypothetical protein
MLLMGRRGGPEGADLKEWKAQTHKKVAAAVRKEEIRMQNY